MAKEIEKFRKELAALDKRADECFETSKRAGSNLNHFLDMFQQGAKQVGEAAQELKAQGRTGSKYDDFKNEKEVKQVVKALEDIHKNYVRDEKTALAARAEAKSLHAEYLKLSGTIEKEVKSRKSKKKIGIDSKSLPDMEELVTEIANKAQRLKDEVSDMPAPDKSDSIWTRTLKNFDYEVGRTKDDRDAELQAELDRQGLDMRVAKRNLSTAQGMRADIEKACKAAMEKDGDTAQKLRDYASKRLDELWALSEQYERALAKIEKSSDTGALQSKDGKALVQIRDSLLTWRDEGAELVRKSARK